jgi:glycosyltransferase involved in cell wall biosynthesis
VTKRSDIRFVCIGDGSAYRDALRLADDLDLAGTVEFTGRLAPDEAMAVLATCDICVQPDPKNAFTNSCTMVKSLEYMALGKPVVAFDLWETRVSCGEAALYADSASATELAELVLRLADDAELRDRLGREGRRRVRDELSWERSATALLRAYGCPNDRVRRPVVAADEAEAARRSLELELAARIDELRRASGEEERRVRV